MSSPIHQRNRPTAPVSIGWLIVSFLSISTYFYSGCILPFADAEKLEKVPPYQNDFQVREKRSLELELDPVIAAENSLEEEPINDFPIRTGRRILNESDSFTEVDGKKKPKSMKELNVEYYAAKAKFFAPPPKCINRTESAGGTTAPSQEGGEGVNPAAAQAPPIEKVKAAEGTPAPAERRRKRRRREENKQQLPFCDELTTTPGGGTADGSGTDKPSTGEETTDPVADHSVDPPEGAE